MFGGAGDILISYNSRDLVKEIGQGLGVDGGESGAMGHCDSVDCRCR